MSQGRNMNFQWSRKLCKLSMKKNRMRKQNLPYTQNLNLFFTSNFQRSCNLDVKTTKNLPRQKLKGQDMLLLKKVKISEVSEFSILSYTQNRKLGNLGKCSFTSNFDSSCNLFRICIFCKQSEALFCCDC